MSLYNALDPVAGCGIFNSEEYYDYISELFETTDTYQTYLFDTVANTHKVLSDLISSKEHRILDLGCGIGSFVNYLNINGFKNTTGVVNSQKLFDISRKKYDINVVKDDMIEYMSKNKKSYDIIFNIESVGYVDLNAYFNAAQECLDDNGVIILKDYTTVGDPYDTGKYYGNYTFHNHETIIGAAKKFGFEVKVTPIDRRLTNQTHFLNSLKKINHKYISSSMFNSKNVIGFAMYTITKK